MAAVQTAPVFFDLEASTEKACGLIREAGEKGATLAAFGETWLPGHPFFVWSESNDRQLPWKAAADYLANSAEIPGPVTDRLCGAAKEFGVDVVIGGMEKDPHTRGTVYCTLLFLGNEGMIL